MFSNSVILITGGTGSFGRSFTRRILNDYDPKKIIIFSRDEMKQEEMSREFHDDPRLRFFLGDVRDKERLRRACQDVDYLVHAAALKIVPTAEYNPFECIKTNVMGAMNIIDCAIDTGVKRVVALSTDKACNPINLYGATKLCSDKLFVSGDAYAGSKPTRFAVVRYGNVIGSRGSVIPLFQRLVKEGKSITITDPAMTRFMITLKQGVDLVYTAFQDMFGGEIYVKKIPSMKVTDIAEVIAPNSQIEVIGIRPGEKLHEQMITLEDARLTYEYDHYFKIFPQVKMEGFDITRIEEQDSPIRCGKPCPPGFFYSSEKNSSWMTHEELAEILKLEQGPLSLEHAHASHSLS